MALSDIVGTSSYLATDGKTSCDLAAVVGDASLIGLYFSAHWCGPCRGFTPKLVTFVEMLAEEGIRFPVVFASSDRDEKTFQAYFAEMKGDSWHAFPHADARIEELKKKYAVSGIPWLVVLNAKTGELVVNEADTDVPKGTAAYQQWLVTIAHGK
uniref:protein-disulfide reductase n=1 Tax=Coccolithus braarudii TaxID=221442 RepID=A0A7S0PW80_9EUKA|mmetsp:Transcript_1896/g.4070  ORF Transcript_1896/g.4070 Transcript_1896/m.4070 type:complete len:155 (+) Transcript_1896:70-534(+)|eukprot:CAMPEP_0183355426 /NCGR_PEP_ID=MMETSP0164_2-20130417/40329_1 /TAXON_ID=221442 /ORGANISM="Coccolithus pelagicus ssp braarudi, Strain PLY182g" /LENGTH=154 /DNA_ID=CAMNT_0025528539 /DNA_START=70 /DNA_END=534 /DNA_ORIENTATION=-